MSCTSLWLSLWRQHGARKGIFVSIHTCKFYNFKKNVYFQISIHETTTCQVRPRPWSSHDLLSSFVPAAHQYTFTEVGRKKLREGSTNYCYCGCDLAEGLERLAVNVKSRQSWVRSQRPRHNRIWGAAVGAVFKNVHKKKKSNKWSR
jgi:hypothetical protein